MGTTCLRCSTSSTTPSSVSYLRVFQKFKMPQPHTIAVISLLIVALTRLAPAQGSCRYTSYGADTVVNDEGNEIAKKRGGYNVCKKFCSDNFDTFGGCKSFAVCENDGMCYLKDKQLDGSEKTHFSGTCKTYRRTCEDCVYTSYGENMVVKDEGNTIGRKRGGANACKRACSENYENSAGCKSFAVCANDATCYLKDKQLGGSEGTTGRLTCKTYRRTCD